MAAWYEQRVGWFLAVMMVMMVYGGYVVESVMMVIMVMMFGLPLVPIGFGSWVAGCNGQAS